MAQEIKLKPCPFCKHEANHAGLVNLIPDSFKGSIITCTNRTCNASVRYVSYVDSQKQVNKEVAKRWNTRVKIKKHEQTA
jgi:hypothetical protein